MHMQIELKPLATHCYRTKQCTMPRMGGCACENPCLECWWGWRCPNVEEASCRWALAVDHWWGVANNDTQHRQNPMPDPCRFETVIVNNNYNAGEPLYLRCLVELSYTNLKHHNKTYTRVRKMRSCSVVAQFSYTPPPRAASAPHLRG